MDCKKIIGLNIFFREGTSDDFVIKEAFEDNIFEKGFPEYKIRKQHVVIDIGAHIGAYALSLSQRVNEGKIYAFEPCLDTFTYLEKNVTANNINNVEIYKVALSNYKGTTKLYYDIENGSWGNSIVKSFSTAGEIVETDTLSGFFEKQNIANCDFIKFNCEGAEFKILLSTPIPILKKIKNMLVLYHLDLTNDYTIEQLNSHLQKAGFYTEIRQKSIDGKRGWLIVIRASLLKKTILTLKPILKKAQLKLKSKLRSLYNHVIRTE